MKKILLLIGALAALSACSPRQIPERRMQAIIRDVILVNAYQSQHGAGSGLHMDSTDIYTPILEGYGYDLADFRYTLDRWALQKSSKLSELIDGATAEIEAENDRNLAARARQNHLDTLIRERYRDTVFTRLDSVWARRRADLGRLRFTIPAAPGEYRVEYRYLIDSADKNGYIPLRYLLLDSLGEALRSNTRGLKFGLTERIDVSFDAEPGIDSLEVILGDYANANRAIAFRADSVYVIYNQPIEEARRRYLSEMIRLTLGVTAYPYEVTYPPQDSGTLHVVPPLRPDTARHIDL